MTMPEKKLPDHLHRDTLAVRSAVDPSQYGENSEALYLTSSFVQPDAATAARRFAQEEEGYTYTRVGNPTVSSMELRLAALEGAEAAVATASTAPALCARSASAAMSQMSVNGLVGVSANNSFVLGRMAAAQAAMSV